MAYRNSQLFSLLDYPRGNPESGKEKLKLLESHGVTDISFVAKGYRGIVFKGNFEGKQVAIKIPRSDASKENLTVKECHLLKYLQERLKSENPAPFPLLCTSQFIIMEWIEGIPFKEAFQRYGKSIIVLALKSCYLLDLCGIEHSEIKGEKHLIYDGKKVRIIDLESAKFKEKPRNLLQFLGYHILRREDLLRELNVNKNRLFELIKKYKENPEKTFPEILTLLG